MFAIFPNILFLAPLAPLIIRVALAVVFVYCAWQHMKTRSLLASALIETIIATALAAGAWTQPAALLALFVLGTMLLQSSRPLARPTLFLALVMCLSLILTGAGALAFDLPL